MFREGKSELVFFLTPEVIDPAANNQTDPFSKMRKKMLDTSKYKDDDNLFEKDYSKDEKKTEDKKTQSNSSFSDFFKSSEPKLTDEEKHKKRVDSILYGK